MPLAAADITETMLSIQTYFRSMGMIVKEQQKQHKKANPLKKF